jgi:ABC-type transport system involved in multi-copper enzyme maturation permease subunit
MGWWAGLPGRVLGPMFVFDAVRAGRRKSTFLARGLFLVGLALILFMFFSAYYQRFQGKALVNPKVLATFAEEFFWVYAVAQFVIVCALTPAFTAAAITDEKERKTLDFLLVTDMSAREIIFGKLGARVGVLCMFVLAGLPILSLIQFFGGVDPRYVLIAAVMTLVTIVSLSAVSIACSVALSRTRDAVVLAYALPVVYLLASGWCYSESHVLSRAFPDNQSLTVAVEAFTAGNPSVVLDKLGRVGPSNAFVSDSAQEITIRYAAFHGVVAILGFAFAALRLRAAARQAGAVGGKPRGRASRLFAWLTGKRTEARKHPPVSDDPVYWREVYVDPGSGSGPLRRLLAIGVVCAVVFPFLSIISHPRDGVQLRIKVWVCVMTGALGVLMLLRAAVRGAAAVVGEKDHDTWTGLIGTPLTTAEILRGKWYGCILGQRGAIYLLAAVWAVGVLTFSVNPVALALTAASLAVYLAAFAWLGIACSVNARNTRTAIARAVPLAILMGGGFWIVPVCFGVCLGIGGGSGTGELLAYGAAFLVGFTPPAVLGGLSALEFSYLGDWARADGRAATGFSCLACGGILGTATWLLIANGLREKAMALFETEANRDLGRRDIDPDDPSDGHPWLRTSTPEPPPASPRGSEGSAGTS